MGDLNYYANIKRGHRWRLNVLLFSEISKYLLQYTRKQVNSIKNIINIKNIIKYGLYYAQLLDTSAEALLLSCDTVHDSNG